MCLERKYDTLFGEGLGGAGGGGGGGRGNFRASRSAVFLLTFLQDPATEGLICVA